MSLIQEIVEMDGKKYLLTDSEENISAAKADLSNLRLYLERSSKGSEISANNITIKQQDQKEDPLHFGTEMNTEVVWDKQSEQFLMQLLLNEANKYRNPRVKKRAFWELICSRFTSEYGKIDVTADSLAKKLANLKRRYTNIRTNTEGKPSKPWHLFASVDEFFKNDESITSLPNVSSAEYVDSPNGFARVNFSPKGDVTSSEHVPSHVSKQSHNEFYYKQKKVTQEIEREKLRLIQSSIEKSEARAAKKDERARMKLEFLKKYHEDHMKMRERELKVEQERNELLRKLLARDKH